MNPTKTQTSAGMETVEQTTARARAMVQPTVSANEIANPPPPVTPPVPQVNTNDGSRTNGLIDNVATNTQGFIQAQSEEAAKANELANILGTQSFDGASQRDQYGREYGLPENIARLNDIQTQLTKRNTETKLQKSQIEGAAGQTIGQAQREVTQADREAAIRDAGLAAEASVLQGNIETASTLINNAMSDYYQDRTLNNQNMIQQLEYFKGIADEQTSQLLAKEQRIYEEDQLNIARALNSVDAAVATGIASSKDVETMTALAGNPKAQKEYADKIVANAARQNYNMRLAEINAKNKEIAATAASEKEAMVKTNALSTQAAVDTIGNIRNSPLGVKAITGVGLGKTSLSAGLATGGTQGFIGGTAAGAGIGSVVPGAGTVFGGALGGVLGGLGGAIVSTVAAANQRTNVASDLSYLVNEGTFAEMRRLKESGVSFGQLTEGERIAIGRAADNLFSALEVDPDGTVTGVKVTEEKFYKLIDDYEQKRLVFQEELNRSISGLDDTDYQAIENAGN